MTDPATPITRQVVIAGDMVVDHHLYEGDRRKPVSSDGRGVRHVRKVGGSAAIRRLLDALAATEDALHAAETKAKAENPKAADPRPPPQPINCALGVTCPDVTPPYAAHHAFALWRPHKMTRKKDDKRLVWRTNLAMGYGHDPILPDAAEPYVPMPKTVTPDPDVLVLDDAGSQFRKQVHAECWHLPKPNAATWILLKLSDPIAQGDLWRALVPRHADHLVVLVAAEDLRREAVRIGAGLSYERTLEDLAAELDKPVLKPLTQAAHLIVTFGGDAAIWISRTRTGDAPRNGATPRTGVTPRSGAARLCFDGAAAEGDFAARHDGRVIGYMTCMAAAIAYALTQTKPGAAPDFEAAMESGLRGMRDLLLYGHGPYDPKAESAEALPNGLPVGRLAKAMRGPATDQTDFSRIAIPWPPPATPGGNWMIVETSQRPLDSHGPRSLIGLAEAVLRRGSDVYRRLPHLRFGDFVTAERREIEALRGIRQLMLSYRENSKVKDRPRSVGVFGPPGAGKSFAVKQIAIDLFSEEAWLEFNLSQFEDARDLIGAFHRVRDCVLNGIIPVVFWDEFDSQNYQWLRSLLAPMQDGQFQEGQITHPIGHAIFIFAGGTAFRYNEFGPNKDDAEADRHWHLSKGPDFKSRLDAYYDVVGPNRRRVGNGMDPDDIGYPLRRALLIRGQLKYKDEATLRIDADLARALLLAPDYEHGSRSLEKLVGPLAAKPGDPLRRSALPPPDQIGMHLKHPAAFASLLDHDTAFAGSGAIDDLAKAIHGYWRNFKEQPGETKSQVFDREWNALSEAAKEDNRAAARRIPAVLALAGLGITQQPTPTALDPIVLTAHLDSNQERLAEAEHDGWKEFRERNGWRFDPVRDDDQLHHPLLVPYNKLGDPARNKDRDAIQHYPAIVDLAGFRIVWLGDETAAPPAPAPVPPATATTKATPKATPQPPPEGTTTATPAPASTRRPAKRPPPASRGPSP